MTGTETRRRGRPSKNADKGALKEAMMRAALELFGEKGFDGASLGMIGQRAGVDAGLARYYFGSKHGLWEASLIWFSSHIGQSLQVALSQTPDDNIEKLKTVIRWFVQMSAAEPWLTRLITFDGGGAPERTAFIAKNVVGPLYGLLEKLIEQAKSDGFIDDVETRTIYFMITHGGSFPMSMPGLVNAFPGGDIEEAESLDNHAESIIRLVIKNKT